MYIKFLFAFLMGELRPEEILEQIHSPSNIHELLELTVRLVDDLKDFKVYYFNI